MKCDKKKIFNYQENNYLKSIKQDLLSLENKDIKVIDIYSLLEKWHKIPGIRQQ